MSTLLAIILTAAASNLNATDESHAFWLDDFMIEDVLAWLSEGPGLAWYEHDAMARRTGSKTACDIPSGGSGGAAPLSLILGTP